MTSDEPPAQRGWRPQPEAAAPSVLDQCFDASSLSALRASTQACAAQAGMPAERATDVVIALHELAANAVRHGAGSGRLRIWDHVGALYCRVDDDGSVAEPPGPIGAGSASQNLADRWPCEPGHGLWLARQVADQMTLRSDARGTSAVITFSLALEPRSTGQESTMLYGGRYLQSRARAQHDHDDWNTEVRGETPMQRADRAYGEILQEIRVAQTGVQLLFAFLLALAFQARFASVTSFQRGTYVVTLMLCAAAAALLIAPAAFHRVVYRRRLKQHLVQVANRLALSGFALLLLSLVSAVFLIMDVILGIVPAIIMATGMFAWFTLWWFVLPLWSRFRYPAQERPRA